MSGPVKVYGVSTGVYSDYSVHAMYRSRADAETAVAMLNNHQGGFWRDGRVESFELYPEGHRPVEIVTLTLTVQIWDDGRVSEPTERERRELDFALVFDHQSRRVPHVRFVRPPVQKGKGGRLEVSGTDHEGVRRTFSDRKAMIVAHADSTGKAGPEMNA